LSILLNFDAASAGHASSNQAAKCRKNRHDLAIQIVIAYGLDGELVFF